MRRGREEPAVEVAGPAAGHARLARAGLQLGLVSVVQVLAMSVWFSTAAVLPSLRQDWGISEGAASWLTLSVQIGFVVGSLLSAVLNLGDRIAVPRLIACSALLAGVTSALVPLVADGLASGVALRFATGIALAGVYPTGIKLVASWCVRARGLAMGVLVAALTVGSATPHLVNGLGSLPWRDVLAVTSGLAFAAAAASLLLREGPLLRPTPRLHPTYVVDMFRDRVQRLVSFGYFGHMWELYAFWTWLPAYLGASLAAWHAGRDTRLAVGFISFAVIGLAGAAGCIVAGARAGRAGSISVARVSLVVSGGCCVVSGLVFGQQPVLLVAFLAVWGFTVIADSAQFSAALSETANPRYVGTALTAQMAIGFLVTAVAIRTLPVVADEVGWRWAMTLLAIGPVAGVLALRGLTPSDRLVASMAARREPVP